MNKDTTNWGKGQPAATYAWMIEWKLLEYLGDLLKELDRKLDRRLVMTFVGVVMAILLHRHRNEGLWLSQLGSYLVPTNAVAGRKRIEKLLHSQKWDHQLLENYLWQQGDRQVDEVEQAGEPVIAVWDESVVEKAESLQLERLSPVRSSKAARLKRIKPGYFNPPGGRPIFVPGFHWLQVLVGGLSGPLVPAHLCFWATRGEAATTKREAERDILHQVADRWRARVIHVFDRGFAGNPWLTLLLVNAARFVIRWPKNYQLLDETGHLKKAWEIARGKRSWGQRQIWDARRRCQRNIGIVAFPVLDPVHQQPLWLVVSRQGAGKTPWYLLTSEPVHTLEQADRIIRIYARRWQVELSIRLDKSELAFESLRVFSAEVQQRLFLIVALVHSFLLQFLTPAFQSLHDYLLNVWCHRNGKWSSSVAAPLYRLRFALSFFWSCFPPPFLARLN